jgi:3-oxoacyl-[acyl-carrier-protein] synthase-1
VAFAGFGAICAAGLNAAEAANAVLAGCPRIAHSRRHPSAWLGADLVVAKLDCLDDDLPVGERIVELGRTALAQALREGAGDLDAARALRAGVPLLLALPPHRVGLPKTSMGSIARAIIAAYEGADREASRVFDTGHVGFISALALAAHWIGEGRYEACVVGAADSLVDLDYLHWLEQGRRVKARDTPHGFTPGEGAAFAVVRRDQGVAGSGRPGVVLGGVGFGAEPDLWFEGKATQGRGLTLALAQTQASAPAGAARIDCCYADLNGETWRSAEWDFAFLRNGHAFRSPLDLRHPAEVWGDTGAASAALNCLLAHHDLLDGLDGYRRAMVAASSDVKPWRAAVRLDLRGAGASDDSDSDCQ